MTRLPPWKALSALLTGLLVLLLLLTAYLGLREGIGAVGAADGTLRVLASATDLLYGLLALGALIALGLRQRAAGVLLVGWVAALALTNLLGPIAWGHESIRLGIKSGVITGTWLGLLVWVWGYARPRAAHAGGSSFGR